MVINFNGGGGGVTPAQVQEMIDESLSFTTSILNLSHATQEEVHDAMVDPDRWLFSIDYSGYTYLEEFRRSRAGGAKNIYFYVEGATPDNDDKRICDRMLIVGVTRAGEVTIVDSEYYYVPDIIYDLNEMNAAQLIRFKTRINSQLGYYNNRFGAVWSYNGKKYCYSNPKVGGTTLSFPNDIVGQAMTNEDGTLVLCYDILGISNEGVLQHTEYVADTTFTILNN